MKNKLKHQHSDAKGEALKRIAIAQGHLEKVKKMLEGDVYCPDIIHQSQAVQAALKKVDEIVLSGHLESCVLSELRGNGKGKMLDEIMEVFKRQ